MNAARIVLGLFTAAALPYSLPYIRKSRVAAVAVSAVFALYVTAPSMSTWRGPVLTAMLLAWAVPLARWRIARAVRITASENASGHVATSSNPTSSGPGFQSKISRSLTVSIAAAMTLLAASLLANISATAHALHYALFNDRLSIVFSGFLLAVFIGHAPTVLISCRFSGHSITRQYGAIPAVDSIGIAIGWFERALVFIFVAGGQVSGAALALTAKSLARYPALERNEIPGEYFLVGTFTSVLIAMTAAIITRIGIGLPPV